MDWLGQENIPRLVRFFNSAAKDLGVEPKILTRETEEYLAGLDWPGNVRQLENTCRWITVMASGREVHIEDLPQELHQQVATGETPQDWQKALRLWADRALATGRREILSEAVPAFEKALIEIALKHTAGRKRDAAELLGWGRNTLTRKLKELGMNGEDERG